MLRTSCTLLVCGLVCGLTATACGSAAGGHRTSGAPSSPASASITPPATSSAIASPTATPFPRAANGSNYASCADGKCEVLVTHRVRLPVDCCGVAFLEVSRISAAGVDFQGVTSGGMSVSFTEQTPGQDGPSTLNHLAIEVIALKGHRAVIKLSRT